MNYSDFIVSLVKALCILRYPPMKAQELALTLAIGIRRGLIDYQSIWRYVFSKAQEEKDK